MSFRSFPESKFGVYYFSNNLISTAKYRKLICCGGKNNGISTNKNTFTPSRELPHHTVIVNQNGVPTKMAPGVRLFKMARVGSDSFKMACEARASIYKITKILQ